MESNTSSTERPAAAAAAVEHDEHRSKTESQNPSGGPTTTTTTTTTSISSSSSSSSLPPPPPGSSSASLAGAEDYEATHVHAVYQAIALHFSATRHKPWPFVTEYLLSQGPGTVGLDVGCGNGKYLPVNPLVHILGSDRSPALVGLARSERHGEVVVADGLALPHRRGAVDFVICIAVIHHLSTQERRRAAIAALLECVRGRGEGTVLIYVWALEQSSSRRGWDEGSDQDTLVPWVLKIKGQQGETYQRYYHLYRKGELEQDVMAAGGTVCRSGYERDNWWVICSRQSE